MFTDGTVLIYTFKDLLINFVINVFRFSVRSGNLSASKSSQVKAAKPLSEEDMLLNNITYNYNIYFIYIYILNITFNTGSISINWFK